MFFDQYLVPAVFLFLKTLVTLAILDADFGSRYTQTVYPMKRMIELDSGRIIAITRRPLANDSYKKSAYIPPRLSDLIYIRRLSQVNRAMETLTVLSAIKLGYILERIPILSLSYNWMQNYSPKTKQHAKPVSNCEI